VAHAEVIDTLSRAAVAQFRADLGTVLSRMGSYLRTLLANAHAEGGRLISDDHNRELAVKLGRGYADALRAAGYGKALGELLDAFESIAKANEKFIRDELGASFSSPNLKALARLADGSVAGLLLRGEEAGAKLREILVAGANTNAPIADLIEELRAAAGVTLNQAIVEAQTQLMAFHRDGLATESQEAGIDLFTYDGPGGDQDLITRPFCAPLVGKLVTLQDLDEMDNGDNQPKPVSRFLGGYRCRHSLSPISLEEARAMYEAEGRRAVAPGCRLALRIVSGKEDGPAYSAWLDRNRGEVKRGRVVRRKKRVA
jgi:hypothetical protein